MLLSKGKLVQKKHMGFWVLDEGDMRGGRLHRMALKSILEFSGDQVRDKHLKIREVDAGDHVMRRWPSTGKLACPLKLRPLSPQQGCGWERG